MKIAVPKESDALETRVAIIPESAKRLATKKITMAVESGAGLGARASDDEYQSFGATIEPRAELFSADLIMRLRIPSLAEIAELRSGSVLVSPLYPLVAAHADRVKALAEKGVTALAVDMIPRTTVAQMMDVLSSQATIAGYYAVILAATHLPRFFPMLMTAAGTIAPARCLILGAGVAGLSAIGTARRLGAVVEAFDVRKVVKEQVESLGAKFVVVETPAGEETQTAGGYAKEASEAYKKNQAEALARHVKSADVVICTALIPGQRAPLLVTAEMVATMKPGSVIVDLAAEQEGNCALTEPGRTVEKNGVTIIGELNLPARMAMHASQMYSRNMEKLLLHLAPKDGVLNLNFGDEIIGGSVITHGGAIVHPKVKERLAPTSQTVSEKAEKT